jgi:hypothetical protein
MDLDNEVLEMAKGLEESKKNLVSTDFNRHLLPTIKKQFIDIYKRSDQFTLLSMPAVLLMHSMNQEYRFIAYHLIAYESRDVLIKSLFNEIVDRTPDFDNNTMN